MGVLTKSDIVKVKEIDRNVKNKFSFAWLERTVEIASGLKVSLGDDIAKTAELGRWFASCVINIYHMTSRLGVK